MKKIKQILTKWFKEPVIQFLLIGITVFYFNEYVLQGNSNNDDEYTVSVTEGEVNSMQEFWQSKWQRPPTEIELQGLINQRVEEDILFKEATKIGLDKDDDIIRQRLAQKLEFLTNNLTRLDSITPEEVSVYFKENIANYTAPPTVSIIQLFVNQKTHGENITLEVTSRLKELESVDISSTKINSYGDTFSLQSYYPDRPFTDLASLFGVGFANQVFASKIEQWEGPIRSNYGVHLVYVLHKSSEVVPELDLIKELVLEDLQRNKLEAINKLYLEDILARYTVKIENNEVENN